MAHGATCSSYEGAIVNLRTHAAAYEKLYSRWNMKQRPYGYSSAYVAWRGSMLRSAWKHYIKPTDIILDIGGGFGNQARHLPQNFNLSNYFNIDPSYSMVKHSKGQQLIGVGEQLPFPDHYFNCVCCSEVLEHVSDKLAVIKEAYRVLKPDGHFFLSTPRTGWYESLDSSWLRYLIKAVLIAHKVYYVIPKQNEPDPEGVVDIPSDELWLRGTVEHQGFRVVKQYRADVHLPIGENLFWRMFCSMYVSPQEYGHCVVLICQK
jgi:ubiquinone/menaquinone biosynthesis C-methylase UbiE